MKKEYISTRNMSREEWLEKRREGVGGSDAAAVMGESAWGSPLSVYMDKRGLVPDRDMTEAMRQGVAFEDAVAKRFSAETGLKARRCNRMYRHPEHPFMIANIDRQVLGGGGFEGLECKTTSLFNRADFAGGEIPREYYWQCVHYMAVTGARKWHLAVMVLSKAFHRFTILRDEADIERLIRREREFWENHVLAGVPPRPSGLDADDDALRRVQSTETRIGGGPAAMGGAALNGGGAALNGGGTALNGGGTALNGGGTAVIGCGTALNGGGTAIIGCGTAADLSDLSAELDELARMKDEKAGIDRRIRATEQLVRMRMGSCEEALAGSWRIVNREQNHSSLDSARLKADRPDIYALYLKTSPRRVLKISDMSFR